MSWREREWARLNEAERRALFGAETSSHAAHGERHWLVVALVVLSVFVGLGFAYVTLGPGGHSSRTVVYADTTARRPGGTGGAPACIRQAFNLRYGDWVCTFWLILRPGEVTRAAAGPPAGACGIRHVDQATGRWVCDSPTPPDPNTLPTPSQQPAGDPGQPV
jgi:hypothetical protein